MKDDGVIHGSDSPILKAMEVYRKEPCVRTFLEDFDLHCFAGEVIISNIHGYFIMGRPVDKDADPALIVDPAHPFHRDSWNAWLIYLASGDLTQFWNQYPFDLPYVGWERKNRLRFYEFQSIRDRICGTATS